MAEEMGDDVPDMEHFFDDEQLNNRENDQSVSLSNNNRKSLILPTRSKRGGNMDAKAFDQKLIDRALSLLLDYQSVYQFSIVKC